MSRPIQWNDFRVKIPRWIILVLFAGLVVAVMAIKGLDEGWFEPRHPLDLQQQPAILFFNRYKGCECELVVYHAAEKQVQGWSDEARWGVSIFAINLDRRRDLGTQYKIVRAPTLLLIDAEGQIILRQDEGVSDAQPLNLPLFEAKLKELMDGK
jgi:hypothetical protein